MQECGPRQLYCMRGSVCLQGAGSQAVFVPGAGELRRTQNGPSLMEWGAPFPSLRSPLPGALPGTPREAGEAEEANRKGGQP